jgi:MFS family permease
MRILASQLTARFPWGMLSIIILLHVQTVYGNYTSAGAILAAESIAQAISGPLTSRMMGRFGIRRVLGILTLICAAALITIALTTFPLPVVAVLAFVMGLSTPPIMSAVRTIYPKMVPGNLITGLFSLDASAQEIIWIVGPVVAVLVSTHSTVFGLLLSAAVLVGGGAWFLAGPELGRVRIPRAKRRFGAVLSRATVMIATVSGVCFIASFSAFEAGIVATFGHGSIESGIILAIFSIGSIAGGFIFGHREVRPWSMLLRTLIVTAGTALALLSPNPYWLGLVLFFGGMGIAPMFTATFAIVSAAVKFSETAEAYAWVATGQLIGAALGSAVAGVCIDVLGGWGGILVSFGFLIATMATVAIAIPWIPDLRGKDPTPLADTEPIQLDPH